MEQTWHKMIISVRGLSYPLSIIFERQKTAHDFAQRLLSPAKKSKTIRIEGFQHTPLIIRSVLRVKLDDVVAVSVEPLGTQVIPGHVIDLVKKDLE